MAEEKSALGALETEGSVVDQILLTFLAKVEAEAGLADVGNRLRKTLLEQRDDTETELKVAIFGGAAE